MRFPSSATISLAILLTAATRLRAAEARLQPTGAYGVDNLFLENSFLAVTIDPRRGARVIDLLDKRTGKQLTTSQDTYAGCAKEVLHDDQIPGEFMQAAYEARITERGPETAEVVTEYRGQTQRSRGCEFVKTFRLLEGEPFLRVRYRLRTPQVGIANMALRIHNVFAPGGKLEPETARPFIPIPGGPRAAVWNKFYKQYVAGWSAVLRPDAGAGVVCVFDVAKVAQGFNWNVPSIEWYYRAVGLKPGLVWSDEVLIAPTQGLAAVDHADRTAVYETGFAGGKVLVKAYALVDGKLGVQPTVIGPDGNPAHAAPEQTAQLRAGQCATLQWDAPSADVLKNATLRVALQSAAGASAFAANPAAVEGFATPVPERKPVELGTEPVHRVEIARPLRGPEISGSGPVKCDDTGWAVLPAERRPKNMPETTQLEERRVSLDGGVVKYVAGYRRIKREKDKTWQRGHEAGSGLGLADPGTANFYGGGFFDLSVNGVNLRTTTPDLRLLRGSGKAAVDVRWEIDTATVHLRLLTLGGDGALYGQVDLSPKTEVDRLALEFLTFPGGFHGERDRRFRTAAGEFGHDKPLTFAPDAGWLLQYDRNLNPGAGAAAMVFVPGQIELIEAKALSNYGVTTTVTCKPSARRLHFALWSLDRADNDRALERIRAESGPALERLRAAERLFAVGRTMAEPKPKPAGVRLRILELATFAHPEGRWPHRHFEEIERSEYLFTHKYGRPTRYEQFLRRTLESSRYAFRATGQFEYFLRDRTDVEVHTAYRNVFTEYLARLYEYDVVVLNDFPLELLDPYERELQEYVQDGGALVFLGGYGAYGGVSEAYGTWRDARLASLLPVAIESVPDFVEQTDYRKGQTGPWGPGRTRECRYPGFRGTDGKPFQRHGPVMPITATLDWLGHGARIVKTAEDHPIVAGVPLESLAPDYHRVTVRGEATVVARIGRDPAIVVRRCGQGRIAALTLNDPRRFWLWPHTSQLYSQLADWVAGEPERPRVSRMSIGDWGRAVGVELSNPTSKPVTADLVVAESGAGSRRAVRREAGVTVPGGASRRLHFSFADAPRFAPGPVRVTAAWAQHTAVSRFENPVPAVGAKVFADAECKRHYTRSETMAPRVTVAGQAPGEATLLAELIDRHGRAIRTSDPRPAPPNQAEARLPIPVEGLAYQPYGYRVSLRDDAGRELAADAIPVRVCRLAIPEYPIFWYGYGAHNDGDMDCYMTLGLLQRFQEQANCVFGVRGWGGKNCEEVCDRALGMELPLITYCFYTPGVGGEPVGDDKKSRHSPRNPTRLEALRERGRLQGGFTKHPAVHWFYTDDEGTGLSESDFDKEQFRQEMGRAWPETFETVEDHHDVARFHLRGGNLAWKAGFDGLREVLPDRVHFFLQSVGHVAANGGWIWDNFNDSDVNCIDLYPPAPVDWGQCLFYYNAMRSLGRHNGNPGWLMLGEYRETFEWMRAQWWLCLGSGLESHSWYGANYGGGAHGIGVDRIHRIAPYDRLAMRYAGLLARWDKPPSKVAVYWSLASAAQRGEGDPRNAIRKYGRLVDQACRAAAVDLYTHDLYPDVITEAEVLAGKHEQYDAIVLAGVTWEIEPVAKKLAAYAAAKPLMAAETATIKLPGAVPLDSAALAARLKPGILTPDPLVLAEPLVAGEQRYLVLYNHQDKAVETDVVIGQPPAKVVYDVFGRRRVEARSQDGETRLRVKLGGYDGLLLALCPKELPQVAVKAGNGRCGDKLSVDVRAGLKSKTGVVPVEVKVLDPNGRETLYGGPFAVTGGRSAYTIATGVNDPPGAWTVQAEDLITGKTATTSFRLKTR